MKSSKIKNLLLGVIIAVVFLMFSVYGAKLIYDAPEYDNYCDLNKRTIMPVGKNLSDIETEEIENEFRACQENYDEARESYTKNLFIISLVFSIIIIVVSALFIHIESVSGGLMLGSLMFIIYGTGNYWRYMDDLLRFIILGVSLIILIFLGFKIGKRD